MLRYNIQTLLNLELNVCFSAHKPPNGTYETSASRNTRTLMAEYLKQIFKIIFFLTFNSIILIL